MSFNFWQKWLVGVGAYHVLFGLALAFFVFPLFLTRKHFFGQGDG